MNPDSRIKLVSELLDLPLIDSDGSFCGIVDDVELTGGPGKDLELTALLVGPGAYDGRVPRWFMALVRLIAGDRITRVPMDQVNKIAEAVYLEWPAKRLGLNQIEDRLRPHVPHWGAL